MLIIGCQACKTLAHIAHTAGWVDALLVELP
jgi:hypothetical protein